ncbi:TIGR03086 family protein [Nocardioides sp. KIGAM211]|uniref:TIGR03086 family protein n=1 Tax=Nocardioides luti TaxID=2761101 RepID=A0A7X0VAX3_9ACTN|nr:TIGR03086 family protein [Nocardioides luti]
MTAALDGAVELLDRALGYTRVVLADVTDHHLDLPTPCAGWSLDDLLAHMEDALDAFAEAAEGLVEVDRPGPAHARTDVLQQKACALLGAWTRAAPVARAGVRVGDLDLAAPLLVATAALEITVHGWDVGQSTGRDAPIPDDLARMLLAVARTVVDPSDRGRRFDSPRPTAVGTSYDVQLLAFLGRHLTGPPGRVRGNRGTTPGVAS